MDKYMQAYKSQVHAMLGPDEWPIDHGIDKIFPPIVRP